MAAPAVHRDRRYGIIWGNVASGAADFDNVASLVAISSRGLPQEAVVQFNKNANQRRPMRMSGERMDMVVNAANDAFDVSPMVTITVPVYFTSTSAANGACAMLLSSLFQDVAEAVLTPFNKIFRFPLASVGHPDFSADAGAYFALVEETGLSAADKIIRSLSATGGSLSCYKGQNDGRLYLTLNCIGRYLQENIASTGYTGTITFPETYTYLNFNQLQKATVDIGGGGDLPVSLYGFTINIDTGLVPTPTAGYHGATGYNETNRVNRFYKVSGSIDILWDANARTMIGGEVLTTGTEDCVWKFFWAVGDPCATTGEALIKLYTRINSDQWQGQDECVVRLEFDGLLTTGGSAFPIELQIADAIDLGAVYTGGFWV